MAPIDCSGLAAAAGLRWFCKHCCLVHRDKAECGYYRPFHSPHHTVENSAAAAGLPDCLARTAAGIVTRQPVKRFTRFGPLTSSTAVGCLLCTLSTG